MAFDDTVFRPGDTDNNLLRKILQKFAGGGGGGGGAGTVTSVGLSAPSLFTVTGSPVTTAGTIALSYGAGTLPVANGGTNISSYTTGDLLYASAPGTLTPLADVATGNALISGGVGTAPAWGKINLNGVVSHISGTLPLGNGGTGRTTWANGDLVTYSGATGLDTVTAVASGNALISSAVGVAPIYGKIGLTTHVSGTLAVGNGGTGTGTAFTQNSVVFAGAAGVYSQDNANFFWDATNAILNVANLSILQTALAFGATTNIDFNAGGTRTLSLTGNVTFTTSNRAANKSVTLKILCDGTQRTLTFPAWIFIGVAAPVNIAINKTAVLSLTCFGPNDTDIVAAYAVQL